MNALIVWVSHHADIYHPIPTHNPYQACLLSFSLSPLTFFLTRLLLLRALQPLHLHRSCKHGGLRGLQTQHSWPTLWKVQERLPQKWVCQTGWCKCMPRSVYECCSHATKKCMHGGKDVKGYACLPNVEFAIVLYHVCFFSILHFILLVVFYFNGFTKIEKSGIHLHQMLVVIIVNICVMPILFYDSLLQ